MASSGVDLACASCVVFHCLKDFNILCSCEERAHHPIHIQSVQILSFWLLTNKLRHNTIT